MQTNSYKPKGFTLIELLLVIALLAILSFLAVPLSLKFFRSQAVAGAQSELLDVLTRARTNAVLQKADSRYGVYIDPNPLSADGETLVSFTLYRGNDYDARNSDYDELYTQPTNLLISATGTNALLLGDINFSKLAGTSTATGTITITHGSGDESADVTIDSFGNAYLD